MRTNLAVVSDRKNSLFIKTEFDNCLQNQSDNKILYYKNELTENIINWSSKAGIIN